MMKTCSKCSLEKDASEFSSRGNGYKHKQCKQCKHEVIKKHYEDNKDIYKQRAKVSNDALRQKVREVIIQKKDKPCTDCGKSYPHYVMDFDHISGVKVCGVSELIRTRSVNRVLEEIGKCEVVCSNCHRERTRQRRMQGEPIEIGGEG